MATFNLSSMPSSSDDISGTRIDLGASTYSESSAASSKSSDGGAVALPSVKRNLTAPESVTRLSRANGFSSMLEQITAPESAALVNDPSAFEDEDGDEPYDDCYCGWRPKGGSTTNSSGKPKDVVKPGAAK
ncbi:hypothetical protein NUW54_g2792 [Trametes sanguinea]|uniref:Uncharacterized protein n=2 Tax=Trametes sanguinea TaxID=158606 RepID=A0ACC1Q0K4_9APHY|nr:hypothetical protein NUW54_g3491 [Trametes sanguinea]KAJ3009401.1 hypothetical protein NUW54_g2792 [Trametes sanguinea]